jgi:hypothetical protein
MQSSDYTVIPEIPKNIKDICQNIPNNNIEKAKRYDADIASLRNYILDLRTDLQNMQAHLDTLKNSEKHFEALRSIQQILNESVGFPVPC